MSIRTMIVGAAALLLAAGCQSEQKADEPAGGKEAASDAKGSSGGERAEVSISVPGVRVKVDIPEGARGPRAHGDSDILYPGSKVTGVDIRAGAAKAENLVELRFTAPASPKDVAAWYGDPARGSDFTLEETRKDGDGYRMSGRAKDDDDGFELRFGPGGSGGTAGRIVFRERA